MAKLKVTYEFLVEAHKKHEAILLQDHIHHSIYLYRGVIYNCAWESPSLRYKIPEGRWVVYTSDPHEFEYYCAFCGARHGVSDYAAYRCIKCGTTIKGIGKSKRKRPRY